MLKELCAALVLTPKALPSDVRKALRAFRDAVFELRGYASNGSRPSLALHDEQAPERQSLSTHRAAEPWRLGNARTTIPDPALLSYNRSSGDAGVVDSKGNA